MRGEGPELFSDGAGKLNWQEQAGACCLTGTCPEAALLQAQEHLGPWSRHLLWSKACPSCSEVPSTPCSDSLSPSAAQLCFLTCTQQRSHSLQAPGTLSTPGHCGRHTSHHTPQTGPFFPRQLARAEDTQPLALSAPMWPPDLEQVSALTSLNLSLHL